MVSVLFFCLFKKSNSFAEWFEKVVSKNSEAMVHANQDVDQSNVGYQGTD